MFQDERFKGVDPFAGTNPTKPQAPAQPGASRFSDPFVSDPTPALEASANTDPTKAAKAQRLGKELGADPALFSDDPDSVERELKSRRAAEGLKQSPKSSAWLSDPSNAAVVHSPEAIEYLRGLEAQHTTLSEREQARVNAENARLGRFGFWSYTGSVGAALGQGVTGLLSLGTDLADAGLGFAGVKKESAEQILWAASPSGMAARYTTKWLQSKQRVTPRVLIKNEATGQEEINWAAMLPTNAGGIENILNMMASEAAPTVAQIGLAAATGGASAPATAVSQTGKLTKLLRVAKGIARYAKSPVSVMNAARVAQGSYENGVDHLMSQGMSEDEARQKAAPGAALAMIMSPLFGGALEAKFAEDVAKRLVRTPGMHTIGGRLLARLKAGAVGAGVEGLQESLEGIGEDLAAAISYNPDITLQQVTANIFQNFVGGVAIGGPISGVSRGTVAVNQGKAYEFVQALADSHKAVEFAKVAPEKLGDYVQKLTQGGPVENLFMGAEDWVRYFQAEGLDPKVEAEKLGITPEDFDMAVERGADLVLPTGKVAETLAATDHFQKLLPNLKPEQGGLTFGEEQRAEQARLSEEEIRKLMQTTPVHPEEAEIASRVEAQLTEAKAYNGNRTAIEETAKLHARVMTVLASRAKMTPMQLYQREELNIRRSVEGLSRQQAAAVRLSPAGREAMSLVRARLEASRQGQTPTQDGPVPAADPALAAPKAPGQAQGSPEAQNPVVEASSEQIQTPESELADRLLEAFERAGIDPSLGTEEEAIAALENWLQDQVRLEQAYSTRFPTAKKTPVDPHTNLLLSGIEAMKLDPAKYAENVRIVSHHPGINMPSGLSVDEQAEFWLTHVETNLLYLFDNTPQRIRDRAKLWYVGANRIANQWAEEFGLSTHQVAVAMAALSPQKDWFQNVHLARVVLEVMRDQQDFQWSPEMEKTAQSTPAIKKDRATAKIRGKKLGELQTDLERAVWIRTFNETYSDRSYRAVTPEGGFGDIVTTAKGAPVKAAWGSFSEIAKAVTAIRTADHKVLSTLLGEAHKVRNFYNNIFDPNSEKFVTIDTHAGAAGLFLPLAGNNREVAQIFGSSVAKKHWSYDPEAANPPSSGVYGTSGTYGLFQEAYNRAAAKRGVLPREMQSITWEAIRTIFTDSDKTQDHYERAVSVWLRYENNEITHKQAMDEIVQAFRGTTIDKAIVPSWAAGDAPSAESEAERWGDGQARLTVESLPSTKVLEEVIPELINATPEQRQAYHAAKMQIISEALAEAGLPVAAPTTGFGYWEGAVNLSTGILLNTNDPAVVKRAAQIAWWSTRDQDGIGYQVPVNVDAELDRANGLMVELPEDITEEQAIALGTALAKAVPESYPDLTNLRMIRIINWGLAPGESGLEAFQQFHTAATEVISSVMPDLTGNPQVFETITELYEGDPTNATRTSSANEGGTPDADASIADRAWSRVQQLNQRTREELQRERLYQAGPAPSFQARAGGANPVSVQGVHFSPVEGLTTLDPSFFGKGSAGAERRRLSVLEPGDPRLLRTNFYVSKDGQLPRREMTVRGQNVYEAELTNLYDMAADPEGLRANAGGDANAFEQAVIDAGYDGYMSPAPGVNGSVVLLGVGPVPVRSLGTATTEQATGKAPITLDELRALRGEEEGEVGGGMRVMQSAFHGSPHRFDQFTLDAIGSGEGAQAYGWGLYFAGDRKVAEWYRSRLASSIKPHNTIDGRRITPKVLARLKEDEDGYVRGWFTHGNGATAAGIRNVSAYLDGDIEEAMDNVAEFTERKARRSGESDYDAAYYDKMIAHYRDRADALTKLKSRMGFTPASKGGALYKVEIPENDQLLTQETPISEQSKQVQDALKAIVYSLSETNLEDMGLESHAAAWREFRSMPSAGLVYHTLASLLGGDKAVSLKMNEHGIPGMRYLDGNSRSGADGNYNYIIFDDSAVQVLETFYQNARGYLEFAPAQRGAERRRFELGLLKGADRSTVFHELGHFYMEVLGDLAALPDADASLKADYQTIRSWLGAEGSAPLTREQHEKFADGWLTYLLEGKAPIPDLVRPFQKFSRWMKKVGAALTGTKIELTDEVRGVFDRLVATEEALDLAKQELGLDLFTSAEAMGMTQAEFDAYKKKLTRLIQGARDKVTRKVFDAYKEQQGEAWKQELDERADEILQELAKRPAYQATAQMLSGRLLDGTEVEVRLSKMWLTEKYGKDAAASIDPDLLATEGGVDADAAAMLLGFDSGDALVNALSGLEPAEEVAYRMAEEAMRLTHGDPMSDPNAMMKASLDALTSNELSDMLSVELKALINKSEALRMGRESYVQMLAGLKAAAREHVAKQPVFKIQPFEFLRAQRKAGNEALRFAKAGNMEKAADAKKRELLNQYLYKEATEAQERAEKFRRFVKQSDKASTRLKMGKAGGDHLAQFDALRDRFGIERLPNKEVARKFTLEKWVEQQVLEGNDTAIDPALLDESQARNYRQLTVEELDALHAALRNIKHLAYKDLYAVIEGRRIERAAMIEELVGAITASAPRRAIPLGGSPVRDTAKFKAAAKLMGYDATMLKIEQLINWIDNDNVQGPAHRYIWNRISKAQTAEYDMQIQVTQRMTSMLESMPKEFRESWDDVIKVEGFPEPLKRSQIITMLLYMGQEERHRKLVGGLLTLGITEEAINSAVERLSPSDVKFVNDVWASFDTIWTDIAALEKLLTGVEPKRQDNRPFTLRGSDGNVIGHLTGGYFPLVADPEHTGELAKKQEGGTVQQALSSNGYARAATSTGHVKELTGKVYPLLLDFQHTMTSHLSNVIKDLTHREVVLDVNRIFQNSEFQKAMREHYGPAYEAQLNPWLVNIVKDHNTGASNGLGAWNTMMTKLRGNTVAAMLGFKFGTVIIQTTDLMRLFAPGEYRLKPLQFLKAVWSFLAHPVSTANAVYELSGEMRHRAENLDRDLRARFDQLRGDESLLAQWNRAGFKALGWMDKLVSMPAWLAAYNQGMKAHGDVDRAVLEADRVVRLRLMTGAPKDIAAIQRQDGMMKLITMFMGDASANYGMLRNAGHRVDGFKGIPALTTTALMVAMSQVLGDLIKGMGPDDDDEMTEWLVMKTLTAPLSTIPLVRDVANLFENYVEGRPIQNYRFTPVTQGVVKPLMAVPATVKWVEGDITWDEWGATSIESLGYAFGVAGTSQFATSAKYLRKVEKGEENPENAAEFTLGVLRGKGGRK